jgi:hypothetical protein
LQFPKNQLFDKTFLAKVEVAWLQKPDVVSKGAQDSSKVFKKEIDDMLEKSELAITEAYFINAVSKVILFRDVEKLVSKAPWFNKAYRSQTVAYTISYLAYLVKKSGKAFNFEQIWKIQSIPKSLEEMLNETAEAIYEYINTPKEGYGNPSQWCRREQCWEDIKAFSNNPNIPEELLIASEEILYISKTAKQTKQLDNEIEIQSFVVTQKHEVWVGLVDYFKIDNTINYNDMDILNKYATKRLSFPSPKQAKVIYDLYNRAISEGYIIVSL